jgi:hypothetical protein
MSSKTLKGVKMATLKTFEEGDTIYASETNANNQALLSLLTDNATQVQKYVEGEIATIKSTVASVQQTLQNAINTKLNKDDVVAYVERTAKSEENTIKFNMALERAAEWITSKGFEIDGTELALLIEASVNKLPKTK